MRARYTTRQTNSQRIGRISTGLAVVLFAISTLHVVAVIRADDTPPADPGTTDPGTTDPGATDPGATGSAAGIMINYLGSEYLGSDRWFIEGVLAAENASAVTIQWGGCGSGTCSPDSQGYFYTIVTAPPSDTITVDASDTTNTGHAELVLGIADSSI